MQRLGAASLESLAELFQCGLDRLGGEWLDRRERSAAAERIVCVEESRVRLDVVEEEAGELGELPEPGDLLLHQRSGRTNALLLPVVPLFA